MSYILDALRKSEQARQQNTAARQYSLLQVIDEQTVTRRHWPYVLAAALSVNAVVFYLWLHPMPPGDTFAIKGPTVTHATKAPVEEKADIAPVSPRDKPASAVRSSTPDDAVSPRSRAEPAPDSLVARVPARSNALARKASKDLEQQSKPVQAAEPPPRAIPERSAKTAVAKDAKSAAAVTAAPQEEPRGPGELPSSLQKELPALLVTGFIREQGSSGMVNVNDKLVREGDEVAPGLKLEKIQDNSLVFSYKGYRFVR